MPRVPKSPVAVAYALYRAWAKLPPAQRRKVLEMAKKHGPSVAETARRHGPAVARAVTKSKRRAP